MKPVNATLFAAFFHFDASIFLRFSRSTIAIAKDLNLSFTQKAILFSAPPLRGIFFRTIRECLGSNFGSRHISRSKLSTLLASTLFAAIVGGRNDSETAVTGGFSPPKILCASTQTIGVG